MNAAQTPKRQMTYHRVPSDHLVKLEKDFQLNHTQLGELFGVHGTSIGQWLREGKAPKWTLLACEGVRRRQRAQERNGRHFVIEVPSEHTPTVLQFLKALGVLIKEFKEIE